MPFRFNPTEPYSYPKRKSVPKAKSAPGSASAKPKPVAKAKSAPGSASNDHLSNRSSNDLMQRLPPELVQKIAESAHPSTMKSLSAAVTNSIAKKLVNNEYRKSIKPATTALERRHGVFKLHHPPRIIRTRLGGRLVNRSNRRFVFVNNNTIYHMGNIGARETQTPIWTENLRTGKRILYSGLHQGPYLIKMRNNPLTGEAKGLTALFAPNPLRLSSLRPYGLDNNKVRAIYNTNDVLFRVYKSGVNYLTRLQHKQHVPNVPNRPMLLMDVYSRLPNNGESLATELLSISVGPDGKLLFELLNPRNMYRPHRKEPEITYNKYNKNGKPSSSAKPSSVTLSDGTRVGLSYRNGMLVQATVKRNGDNSPLHSVGLVGKGARPKLDVNGSTRRVPFSNIFLGQENGRGAVLRPGYGIWQSYF